jgi:hypothetical protein
MKRCSKIGCSVLLLILVVLAGWYYCTSWTGPRSGQVVDAVTGQPIADAIVVYVWTLGIWETHRWSADFQTTTDEQGRYYIPSQFLHNSYPFFGGLEADRVVIYKCGYTSYLCKYSDTGGSCFSNSEDLRLQPYREVNNLVKIERWDENYSFSKQKERMEQTLHVKGFQRYPLLQRVVDEDEVAIEQRMKKSSLPKPE